MCDGPLYYEIDLNEQDPFVMMAWRCTRLSSFSVVGEYLRIIYQNENDDLLPCCW